MAKFDGTFDIDYSGEEVETNVPKSRVRPCLQRRVFPTTTTTTASDTLTLTAALRKEVDSDGVVSHDNYQGFCCSRRWRRQGRAHNLIPLAGGFPGKVYNDGDASEGRALPRERNGKSSKTPTERAN